MLILLTHLSRNAKKGKNVAVLLTQGVGGIYVNLQSFLTVKCMPVLLKMTLMLMELVKLLIYRILSHLKNKDGLISTHLKVCIIFINFLIHLL